MRSRICSARTPKTPRDGRLADGALLWRFSTESFTFNFVFFSFEKVLFEIRQFGFVRARAPTTRSSAAPPHLRRPMPATSSAPSRSTRSSRATSATSSRTPAVPAGPCRPDRRRAEVVRGFRLNTALSPVSASASSRPPRSLHRLPLGPRGVKPPPHPAALLWQRRACPCRAEGHRLRQRQADGRRDRPARRGVAARLARDHARRRRPCGQRRCAGRGPDASVRRAGDGRRRAGHTKAPTHTASTSGRSSPSTRCWATPTCRPSRRSAPRPAGTSAPRSPPARTACCTRRPPTSRSRARPLLVRRPPRRPRVARRRDRPVRARAVRRRALPLRRRGDAQRPRGR